MSGHELQHKSFRLPEPRVCRPGAVTVFRPGGRALRGVRHLPLGGSPSSVPGAAPGRLQANERALARDQRFVDVVTEPTLLDAVEAALGDDVHLLAYEAIEIPSGGGKDRDWHSDFHFPTDAALVVNVGIYLQDMTDDRGPLYVVPGSHRWNREPADDE